MMSSKTERNVLMLRNVSENDSGIYDCYGGHLKVQAEILVGSELNIQYLISLERDNRKGRQETCCEVLSHP